MVVLDKTKRAKALYRFRTFLIAAENFLQILYIRKYLLKKIVGRDKRLRAARAKKIADAISPTVFCERAQQPDFILQKPHEHFS